MFEITNSDKTGILFKNQLTETEDQNILTYEYFYNGGGVAAADFNNDGLIDLYFTGNQVANKLYLNKSQGKDKSLSFEDITQQAGVAGRLDSWKTGVSIVDVNSDGWLDIYVCYSGNMPTEKRKNQLFINNHNLTFTEKAEEVGLADTGYSTQAAWLDYDQDGDLDMFLVNHNLRGYQRKEAALMRTERDENAGDKLFRCDSSPSATGKGLDINYVDVSAEAGIKGNPLGFGLGVVVADVNQDGLPDIYVGNDYVEDDYLYLNQGDGTFKDQAKEMLAHTSTFTMGVDIADFNNDLAPDIVTLDMLPEDNARQKKLIFPDNWNVYQAQLQNGFHHQNMRNMLQVNTRVRSEKQEMRNTAPQSSLTPHFSEIGQLAGISNTDWSWAALFADLDNDGWKDLFITNGEVRDYTDGDFAKYYADEQMKEQMGQGKKALLDHLKQMPASKTHFYAFQNNRNLTFTNKVNEWGFSEPSIANGAICADLDNDGDLDLVTNNNNETAQVYKNFSQERNPQNWLNIKLIGSSNNLFGIGAKVVVTANGLQQYQENYTVRGYQSSMAVPLHFGLGKTETVSLTISWPDGKNQQVANIKVNQTLTVQYQPNLSQSPKSEVPNQVWFSPSNPLDFTHTENPEIDFNHQILLPYLYSYSGARMATGDANGDGLTDVYIGGASNQAGALFFQQKNGSFSSSKQLDFEADKTSEDRDAVFIDADGDKDLDLYVVSGEYAMPREHVAQSDRLYLNDGSGHFKHCTECVQPDQHHGSVVKSLDVEKDGDIDLFVGGSVIPSQYPLAEESYLLLNNGKGTFRKQSLGNLGLVSDAVVVDLDKNTFPDLVVVGEWMSPLWLKNSSGKLQVGDCQLPTESGWFNRIVADDLDNDGDTDFVLGNLGLNCQMHCSNAEPLTLHYGDFDKNGRIDPFMSYFIQGKSYPAIGRDEALEQLGSLRQKFINYESFGKATIEDLLGENINEAKQLAINFAETCILENTGKGFTIRHLPMQAQFAPVYAIAVEDFDHDGQKDILLAGNNSTYRLRIGKMDANQGVLLKGKGKLQFEHVPQQQSGLHLQGDVKDIKQVGNSLIFSINNQKVAVYKNQKQ